MLLIEQFNRSVHVANMGCNTHFYLWSKDKNGKYLSCNKTMYNAVGLSKETDMVGLTDLDLCWEQCGYLFKKNDNIVMHNRQTKIFIEPSQDISGKITHLHSHKQPLLGHRNKVLGTVGWAVAACPVISMNEQIHLSKRYLEIAKHLILGKTSKEIAKALNLSYRTIEYYVAIIKRKFNVKTKSQLIQKLLSINL